ncbi:MAG: DUF4250 domain-containing protein [Clostridia bacterium]|nr:DUF4250 domain-containing protein [Clostridia bacterium]
MAGLPQDPIMLLSVLNMKLRDRYASLDQLCDDLEEDPDRLTAVMAAAGYRYDPDCNAFVPA